jgi:hypothetical protein
MALAGSVKSRDALGGTGVDEEREIISCHPAGDPHPVLAPILERLIAHATPADNSECRTLQWQLDRLDAPGGRAGF